MQKFIIGILMASSILFAAPVKSVVIDGMLCRDCNMGDKYDSLALLIQNATPVAESGEFVLALGMSKDGIALGQTVSIKGETDKTQQASIDVDANYKFKHNFVLLVLRVVVGKSSNN